MSRAPAKRPQPSHDQLVAVIRAYQHANTRDEMEAADARAVALLGPAPIEGVTTPTRKPKPKVARS